ncbi:50S ribosomal protein L3 [bacterium]|nr:50S ribosomal protein L3 [bacterium]
MVSQLLGKKIGMTQIWDADERLRPATVIELGPCVVLQVKTQAVDGYDAVQLGFEDAPVRRKHGKGERRRAVERRGATRPAIGHAKKAGVTPKRFVREARFDEGESYEPGQVLTVEVFADVEFVDVLGLTKGKGFQGTIKRHGFAMGPKTHGSMNVRRPGSIGQSASPSRVIPGTRMSGQMGNKQHTESSISVVQVDPQRNLLIVGGAVPGPPGSYVVVRPAARLAARK